MSDLRKAAQQALKAMGCAVPTGKITLYEWDRAISDLSAALATPVPHGCHVDLEDGIEPDGCVLDEGKPEKCIYAKRLHREGKDKTACEYWQPIEVKK